jgi:very-short-patch-repair endonuclease
LTRESAAGAVSGLAARTNGVFRGRDAVALGLTRRQLRRLIETGVVVPELPDTYRIAAVSRTHTVILQAALLWAGPGAAAAGRSAGYVYALENVRPTDLAEITVSRSQRLRSKQVIVHRPENEKTAMPRRHGGFWVTGVEATLVALAAMLDGEGFEVACEDARRRRLTSMPALYAYMDRFGKRGRPGISRMRALLRELDPVHPSASTLEVKTRRLLVAHGITDFVREFPLDGYRFDFAFSRLRLILETNGRRWHDDPVDYEQDNEKWSVPARHGYRIMFATWRDVTSRPATFLRELLAA